MTVTNPSVGLNAETGSVLTGWEHVLQSLSDTLKMDFADAFENCNQAPGNNNENCCALVDCKTPHQIDPSSNC